MKGNFARKLAKNSQIPKVILSLSLSARFFFCFRSQSFHLTEALNPIILFPQNAVTGYPTRRRYSLEAP